MSLIEQYFFMLVASTIMGMIVYFVTHKEKRIHPVKLSLFVLFLFVATVLSSYFSLPVYRILFLLVVLVVLVKVYYRFTFPMSIVLAITAYFLYILADVISGIIMINGFGFKYQDVTQNFILSLYCHGIIFFISILFIIIMTVIREFIQNGKFNDIVKFQLKRINFRVVFFTYLLITILLIGIFGELHTEMRLHGENQLALLITCAIVVYFFISLVVIYLYRVALKQRFQYEEKEKAYNQLVIYTEVIEGLIKDLRIHKHNYANTLASIKGYLEQEDYESFKQYFYNEILKDENQMMKGKDAFSPLQKITNPGVKGLIATKINYALNHQVQFHVDILENVDFCPSQVETIDICKMLGVFLDNAIEAAMESEKKNVSLFITKNEEDVSIVITNTFKEAPDINKIFGYGYSTKGENRGIGLSMVKDMLNTKYQNMLLNTIVEDDIFIVELIICKA